ncbi:MAG: thiamine phosphate synthase [SAR202 cluster bacterium]|nr:thiamine phosphate synthase [SAR202 cluster bacterium]
MTSQIALPALCLVTDRLRSLGRPIEDVVAAAVEGGVNMVQLREKDLPSRKLYDLAVRLRQLTQGRALLMVNDRLDVALAAGADGVQLGEEGLPVQAARAIAGRLLIGKSVHSLRSAQTAQSEGADFLVAGTIFESGTHPDGPTQGLGLLAQLRAGVATSFLAIGGITAQNVADVIAAGASGAAVITAITQSPSPKDSAREIAYRIQAAYLASTRGHVRGQKP